MHPGSIVLIVIGSVGFLWGSYEIGYRLLDWISYRRDQKKYEEYLRQYYEKHQLQKNDIISSPQSEHYDEKKDNTNPFEDSDNDDDDVPLAYHPSLNLRRRKAYGKDSEDNIIKSDEKENKNHYLQQRGNNIMGIFKDNDQLNDYNDDDDQSIYLLRRSKELSSQESQESTDSQASPSSIIMFNETIEKNDTPLPVSIDNINLDTDDETLMLITKDKNNINSSNINNDNDSNNTDTNTTQQTEINNDQSIYQSINLTQQGSESEMSSTSLSHDSWTSLRPSYSSDNMSFSNHHQQQNNSLFVSEDIASLSSSSSSSFSVVSISDDER